jgi:thermitase
MADSPPISPEAAHAAGTVPGQLIVGFKSAISEVEAARIHAAVGATVLARIPEINADVVTVSVGNEAAALAAYQQQGEVAYAQVDELLPLAAAGLTATPNDPLLRDQWYLDKIGARAAFAVASRAKSVTVALLDSGINRRHPDLRGRVSRTADFFTDKGRAEDTDGHGTMTAGLIAARANNGVGIAGVAPNARVMEVKIAPDGGFAAESTFAEGLIYAANHGAKVISMSVGTFNSAAVRSAFNYAIGLDIVLVAAAGNSAASFDRFSGPYYPNVIAVGATDRNDNRASFSNYGSRVLLAAPGVDIESTSSSGLYHRSSGTSFSAPLVAGAAAILRGLHRDWSAGDVRRRLCDTADHTAGTGSTWVCGRLNVAAAVGVSG